MVWLRAFTGYHRPACAPPLVVASAGDILTEEALAAVAILREYRLQPDTEHPHGLSDRDFDSLFTMDKPVIFNFHGYPSLIHKFTYRRTNHAHIHVRGYKEKGNINTPLEFADANERPVHRGIHWHSMPGERGAGPPSVVSQLFLSTAL